MAKIAEEEVAHVAVGLYWFLSVCQKMGRAPDSTFKGWEACLTTKLICLHTIILKVIKLNMKIFYIPADLLEEYNVELKGPFNYVAREEAGIPRDW